LSNPFVCYAAWYSKTLDKHGPLDDDDDDEIVIFMEEKSKRQNLSARTIRRRKRRKRRRRRRSFSPDQQYLRLQLQRVCNKVF
jgi:hypothetical protein